MAGSQDKRLFSEVDSTDVQDEARKRTVLPDRFVPDEGANSTHVAVLARPPYVTAEDEAELQSIADCADILLNRAHSTDKKKRGAISSFSYTLIPEQHTTLVHYTHKEERQGASLKLKSLASILDARSRKKTKKEDKPVLKPGGVIHAGGSAAARLSLVTRNGKRYWGVRRVFLKSNESVAQLALQKALTLSSYEPGTEPFLYKINGKIIIVEPFLYGLDLVMHFTNNTPFSAANLYSMSMQLAQQLIEEIWKFRCFHGDISAANTQVNLDLEGNASARLRDLDLAMTLEDAKPGKIMGTHQFLPAKLFANGNKRTLAAELYGLGALIKFMGRWLIKNAEGSYVNHHAGQLQVCSFNFMDTLPEKFGPEYLPLLELANALMDYENLYNYLSVNGEDGVEALLGRVQYYFAKAAAASKDPTTWVPLKSLLEDTQISFTPVKLLTPPQARFFPSPKRPSPKKSSPQKEHLPPIDTSSLIPTISAQDSKYWARLQQPVPVIPAVSVKKENNPPVVSAPVPLNWKLYPLPKVINADDLADPQNQLLYTKEQLLRIAEVCTLGSKMGRKTYSNLHFSFNFLRNPQDQSRACILIHYRKNEFDDVPLFSAKTLAKEKDEDKQPGGAIAEGTYGIVRSGQLVHLINVNGAWQLDPFNAPEWVAYKMAKARGKENEELKNEAEKTRKLGRHENRSVFFHYDKSTGKSMMVMPLLDGLDLSTQGVQEPKIVLFLASKIWEHLQDIFENNHLHRDLKPENIISTEDDVIKIVDFGCAIPVAQKLFAHRAGTAAFVPPEVLAGEKSNEAADLYAFGKSLMVIAGLLEQDENGDFKREEVSIKGISFTYYAMLKTAPQNRDKLIIFNLAQRLMEYQQNKLMLESPNGKLHLLHLVSKAINDAIVEILKPVEEVQFSIKRPDSMTPSKKRPAGDAALPSAKKGCLQNEAKSSSFASPAKKLNLGETTPTKPAAAPFPGFLISSPCTSPLRSGIRI